MIGVIASYEARRSLWTIARQIPVLMLTMVPMIAVIHIAQHYMSTVLSLALGWVALLLALAPFLRETLKSVDADNSP
jgi:Ca2+/Na+ antiporter